jgi:hypothetical protein
MIEGCGMMFSGSLQNRHDHGVLEAQPNWVSLDGNHGALFNQYKKREVDAKSRDFQ